MKMMWAEHRYGLEPLTLLSAQWSRASLERCGQIFFGGVFDKRVGMHIAARRHEDGNVHRSGDSKTVIKNMWEGFFKNQKIKERPDLSAAGTAEMYFHGLIPDGMFTRCTRLTLKSAFRIVLMMKVLSFPTVRRTSQPEPRTNQPEGLTFLSLLTFDALTLTMQKTAAFIGLTTSPIGLTLPSILTADDGVKTATSPHVRTTCFDVSLLAMFVRLIKGSNFV